MMVKNVYTTEEIANVLLPLLKKYKAQKAVIFGSYARKEADKNSDIDVMIIGGDGFEPTDVFCIADELHRAVQKPVDVYEQREIDQTSSLYRTIVQEGVEVA